MRCEKKELTCQRELEKLCEGPMCHRGTQRIGVQGGGD